MSSIPLGELMPSRVPSINPANFPNEDFELWSIPAFDSGQPEKLAGSQIGSSKKCVEPGDVLLSRIVPHIRRSWVVEPGNGVRQIASGEWIIFRGPRFFPPYLRQVLISDPFHVRFMQTVAGVGGSLLRARPEGVKEIEIPLPPLEDQKRIAAILDEADSLRRLRQRAIDRLEEFLKSTFLEFFGDPIANPMDFPIRSLPEFYINNKEGTKCGPFGSALKKEEYVDKGVPVWNMDNISPLGRSSLPFRMWVSGEKYKELEAYSVVDGDVLISRAGTVGKMCVADSGSAQSILSTNLIRVRFGTDLLAIYFVCLMTYGKGRVGRLKTGPDGSFTHMNTGVLDTLKFPYPSLDMQRRFAAIVNSVEEQKAELASHLSKLNTLFSSLQHRAFRGEL